MAAGWLRGCGLDPVDCEDCGGAAAGTSSRSNGLVDLGDGVGLSRERLTASPGLKGKFGDIGVRDPLEDEESLALLPLPSPSRTRVSMVFSTFPPRPFSTARFLLSSMNPMSRNLAILPVKSRGPAPLVTPKMFGSLLLSGEGDLRSGISTGGGGSRRDFEDRGNIEEADRKPNLLPVLGGSGGG